MPEQQFEVGDYIEWRSREWIFRGPVTALGSSSDYVSFRSEEVTSVPAGYEGRAYINNEWYMPTIEMVLIHPPLALYDAIMAATEVENANATA